MTDITTLNKNGRCPDCRSTDFIIGPSGGLAVNIRCAKCGAKFWYCPPFTPTRLEAQDDSVYVRLPTNLWEYSHGPTERAPRWWSNFLSTWKEWWRV